jgi:phage shock protein A
VHLGGKKSQKSKDFRNELTTYFNNAGSEYRKNKSLILEQINSKDTFQKELDSQNLSIKKLYENVYNNTHDY